jgi:hypothetical protein
MPRRHVREWRYSFTILDLYTGMEMSAQLHARIVLSRGKSPSILWVVSWVGPRTSMGAMEKKKILSLPGIEPELSSPIARRYTDFYLKTENS